MNLKAIYSLCFCVLFCSAAYAKDDNELVQINPDWHSVNDKQVSANNSVSSGGTIVFKVQAVEGNLKSKPKIQFLDTDFKPIQIDSAPASWRLHGPGQQEIVNIKSSLNPTIRVGTEYYLDGNAVNMAFIPWVVKSATWADN